LIKNIDILKQACKKEGLSFEEIHPNGNILEVKYKDIIKVFSMSSTPFNDQTFCDLCDDKEYFYLFYKDYIAMPKTKGYLTPNCESKYKYLLKSKNLKGIAKEISSEFSFPIILKRNRGRGGDCVFKVKNKKRIISCLEKIYKQDYVALVQECIDVVKEYRVIFFDNELIFAYEKDITGAKFKGNLSPLHQDEAFARIVEDKKLLEKLEKFGQKLSNRKTIPYIGLDIVIDSKDEMYILEANSRPGFSYFLQAENSEELLLNLYIKMLRKIKNTDR